MNDIEQLIKAALQEGESRTLTVVEKFIEEVGIIPSVTEKIPNYHIWLLYKDWVGNEETMKKEEFFKQFSRYFKKTHLGRPHQWRGYYAVCPKVVEDAKWLDYAEKRKKRKRWIKAKEKHEAKKRLKAKTDKVSGSK